MVAREVTEALERLEQAVARRVSYEEARAALDACARLPGGDTTAQAIAGWRVTIASLYNRPAAECEEALLEFLGFASSLDVRADRILAVCADYPELADRYLAPLIADLEDALVGNAIGPIRHAPEQLFSSMLHAAYNLRERLAEASSGQTLDPPQPMRVASSKGDPGYSVPLCGQSLLGPAHGKESSTGKVRPLDREELHRVAYHYHPRLDPAGYSPSEFDRLFRESVPRRRLRTVQKVSHARIRTWRELVTRVHRTLRATDTRFFVMDSTNPSVDTSYAIELHARIPSASNTRAIIQVSHLVPCYCHRELHGHIADDGNVAYDATASLQQVNRQLEMALRTVERAIMECYGYWRLDEELAASLVPGIYIDGHSGRVPPTLADALFGPYRW